MRFRITLLIILMTAGAVYSQTCNGWNWSEDEGVKSQEEEKVVLYTDYKKANDFKSALPHLNWLLKNNPSLNKSIYINGAQIYEGLAEMEKNPTQKKVYQDSALVMYDLRIQYCNEEANVMNRKAFTAYKYYKGDKSKYKELYELFDKTFELNEEKVWDSNLTAYMDVIRRYKLSGGEVSIDDVLDRYDLIMSIVDKKAAKKPVKPQIVDTIDRLLTGTIDVNCEFISDKLVPKLNENPDDIKLAKKIIALSLTAKCTDESFFVETAKKVVEKEPNFGMNKIIGDKCFVNGDYTCAETHYLNAVSLTEDNIKIADIYENLYQVKVKNGSKSTAREYARKALAADPTRRSVYTLIGNLYMTSYDECRKGESRVEDRLVFLAAYDQYQKAGDSKGMANASEQFPSIEDIFTENRKEGDAIKCNCWINTTVTLRKRN